MKNFKRTSLVLVHVLTVMVTIFAQAKDVVTGATDGGYAGGGNYSNTTPAIPPVQAARTMILEYLTLADRYQVINGNPPFLKGMLEEYGAKNPDVERFRAVLGNIRFMPKKNMTEVNEMGGLDDKDLNYDNATNSLELLQKFFAEKTYLNQEKLIEDILHESSHAAGLGNSPQLDYPQSRMFAQALTKLILSENNVEYGTQNRRSFSTAIGCGWYGSIESRIKSCSEISQANTGSMVHWLKHFGLTHIKLISQRWGDTKSLNTPTSVSREIEKSLFGFMDSNTKQIWYTGVRRVNAHGFSEGLFNEPVDEYKHANFEQKCETAGKLAGMTLRLPTQDEMLSIRNSFGAKTNDYVSYFTNYQLLLNFWLYNKNEIQPENQLVALADGRLFSADGQVLTVDQAFNKVGERSLLISTKKINIKTFCVPR